MLIGAAVNLAPGCSRRHRGRAFCRCLEYDARCEPAVNAARMARMGNPIADPAAFAVMALLFPYDNVGAQPYRRSWHWAA